MPPILATIISGFLGSGKTTFVNRLLHEPHGKRIAVIVNELGEIGIDGALIGGTETFVELENGCLCCSLNPDLEKTLMEIKTRGGIDHVMVETTGVADPLTILWTFTRPQFESAFLPNLIVTVADLKHIEGHAAAYPVAQLQLEQAHCIAMSKTDLVSEKEQQRLRGVLERLNPNAVIVSAGQSDLGAAILDASWEPSPKQARVDTTHHYFNSISFATAGRCIRVQALEDFLDTLPRHAIRAKGVLWAEQDDGARGFLIFHKVADDTYFEWVADYRGPQGIVVIGQNLRKDEVHDVL